jgi:hypothetical protein
MVHCQGVGADIFCDAIRLEGRTKTRWQTIRTAFEQRGLPVCRSHQGLAISKHFGQVKV